VRQTLKFQMHAVGWDGQAGRQAFDCAALSCLFVHSPGLPPPPADDEFDIDREKAGDDGEAAPEAEPPEWDINAKLQPAPFNVMLTCYTLFERDRFAGCCRGGGRLAAPGQLRTYGTCCRFTCVAASGMHASECEHEPVLPPRLPRCGCGSAAAPSSAWTAAFLRSGGGAT
jgi:hypothetical protein